MEQNEREAFEKREKLTQQKPIIRAEEEARETEEPTQAPEAKTKNRKKKNQEGV